MSRPDLSRVPKPFHVYVNHVKENDLKSALEAQSNSFIDLLEKIPDTKVDYRYAEGKWTTREVLQHILDAERVFAYRALCIARKDATPLPSFDENEYADKSKAGSRNWKEMIEEFKLIRGGNRIMFNSFDNEQLETAGTASNRSIYVLALGYVLVGHVTHHVDILKERYLNN